ncbi:MAG: hypothetical protein JXR76_19070 [Deltaproteobacteria bacterium]|nr:hypothetical protein [Deltaproteobacteria bacterium]
MQSRIESYMELLERDASKAGLADFRLAREEFHKLTGEFEEGEPWFETRMTMFMDWYLLDRKGPGGKTPIEKYLAQHEFELNDEDLRIFQRLNVTLRSSFQIQKIKGDQLLLEDLILGGQWKCRWVLPSVGLKTDDIFNSRLILVGDEIEVGRGAVLHPVDAHEALFEILDRARREHLPVTKTVYYLDKVKLKLDRYSNVKIRHVYKYPTEVVF